MYLIENRQKSSLSAFRINQPAEATHLKLGLIKQFVKALDKDDATSKYLQKLFPKLSEAKVKGGIFNGPQVKLILKSDEFLETLSAVEKDAWICFAAVVQGFL